MTPEEQQREAREKIQVLETAKALNALIQTPGWKLIYAFQEAALEQSRLSLRKVDTGNTAVAIAELQKWQIAENMLEAQVDYINRTLEEAVKLRGAVTLEDALLMEHVNEQSQPAGDSGGRSDPTGY